MSKMQIYGNNQSGKNNKSNTKTKMALLFVSSLLLLGLIGVTNAQEDNLTDEEKKEIGTNLMEAFNELSMIVQDANITLVSEKMKNDEIVGQVKNIGNGTAEYVQIGITGYDSADDVTATDYTYADASTLERNKKSSFNIFLGDDFNDVESYDLSLQWRNPDGTDEYLENVTETNQRK